MKKIFTIFSIALLTLSSCQKEQFTEVSDSAKKGVKINFVGEAFEGTKTTIGAKDGSTYPVLWAKGDKIGIISQTTSATDTLFKNASATLYGEGGSNSGIFVLDDEVVVESEQNVVIYYPRASYTSLSLDPEGNLLKTSIPMEQKQAKAGDNSYTGKYALAISTATIKPTVKEGEQYYQEPVKFSLKHSVAYVKLSISSSKYASYKLAGASLWCEGAALTGDISVNMTTGAVKNVTPRSYAVVTVEEPSALSAAQDLWLVTLPADLTGKDVYVTVSMTDGSKNVSIPVKVTGGNLKANTVNTINVVAGDNTISWYEPEETRFLAEAYAYGAENTIMVTNTNSFTFDVKVRGYFIGCKEPKYVWAPVLAYGQTAPALTVNGKKLAVVASKNTVTAADCAEVSADGTITIDYTGTDFSSGKTRMSGKIVLADENLNTIWAFNLWHVGDYNDGVIAHTYKCGKQVMDRYLGAGYEPHSYDNWHGMGMYFQWGRPFGFGWSGGGAYKSAATSCTDISVSARKAETFFTTNEVSNTRSDWYLGEWTNRSSDAKNDAWGNPANADETDGSPRAGTKSVLDPCPKGWMVCSPDVLKEVISANPELQLHAVASTATANGEWGKFVREAVYKFGTGAEDVAYWRFDGLKWGSNAGNPTNQINDILSVYSNSSIGPNSSYVADMYYRSKDAKWTTAGSRNSGCSVRCMKDTDNR